jgi:hypothetical protein
MFNHVLLKLGLGMLLMKEDFVIKLQVGNHAAKANW